MRICIRLWVIRHVTTRTKYASTSSFTAWHVFFSTSTSTSTSLSPSTGGGLLQSCIRRGAFGGVLYPLLYHAENYASTSFYLGCAIITFLSLLVGLFSGTNGSRELVGCPVWSCLVLPGLACDCVLDPCSSTRPVHGFTPIGSCNCPLCGYCLPGQDT